jgi:hypothetical protein
MAQASRPSETGCAPAAGQSVRRRDRPVELVNRTITRRDLLHRATMADLGGLLRTTLTDADESHAAGRSALSVGPLDGGPTLTQWTPQSGSALLEPSSQRLPRWRGFNLLAKFNYERAPESETCKIQRPGSRAGEYERSGQDGRLWLLSPLCGLNTASSPKNKGR